MITNLENGFYVAGISVKTDYKIEKSTQGQIPSLWGRFFKEKIAQEIPDRLDQNLYAVYFNYTGTYKDSYTCLIGVKVQAPITNKKISSVFVNPGKYQLFLTDPGVLAEVVPLAWMHIWDLEERHILDGKRDYKTDFEVYGPESRNPEDGRVKIYVSII